MHHPNAKVALALRATLALLVAASAAAGPVGHAQEPAGGPPPAAGTVPAAVALPEAIDGVSAAVAALGDPQSQYAVGVANHSTLLNGYIVKMLAVRLGMRGARVQGEQVVFANGNSAAPEALPRFLVQELRSRKADLFVLCTTAIEGGERYLTVTTYDVSTGKQRARTSATCLLSDRLAVLVAAERERMTSPDRRWLKLFEELFAPGSPPGGEPEDAVQLAEAEYFFDVGLWASAAPAYLEAAGGRAGRSFLHAVVALQLGAQAQEATSLVESACKQDPTRGPLWALRAWLSFRQGHPDDAVIWLEQARLCGIAREGLYRYAAGLLALEQADDVKAEQELMQAAKLEPGLAFVQLRAARFYRDRAEMEKSIAYFRAAARAPTSSPEAWGELAMALELTEDVEGAIAALRRGFILRSDNLIITKHLAALLKRQGRHQEALGVLRRAAEANPGKPSLLAAYGDGAAEMWKVDEAARAYQEAVTADETFAYGQMKLATMLARRREYGQALALLNDLVAKRPDYSPARVQLGCVLGELGRLDESVSTLKEAAKHAEHEVSARLALCDVYLRAGHASDALAPAQIAASARPSAETFACLSAAFLAVDNLVKAEMAADTAVAEDAGSDVARVARARVLLAGEHISDALQETQEALRTNPYSVEALQVAGAAAEAVGDFRRCAELWRRALALNPWDAQLHLRLSKVLGPKLGDWSGTQEHHGRYVELERLRTQAAR